MKLKMLYVNIVVIYVILKTTVTFATTGVVELKSDTKVVKVGDTFTVTLCATSEEGINGIDTKYSYDFEKLELISAELVNPSKWSNLGTNRDITAICNTTETIKNADVYKIMFKVKENVSTGDLLKIETSEILLDTDAKINSEFLISPKKIEIKVEDKLENSIPFKDVKEKDWYYSAVKYVYQNNIIKGYNKTTYAPKDKLTRAMMITILYRMEGSPKTIGDSKFKDIKDKNAWYYNAVIWASNNKIASGYDNLNFGPNDNITREQLAVFMYKYAKFKGKNVSTYKELTNFKDGDKVSKYAETQIKWATAVGVITGNSNTTPPTLNPTGTATRAEVASIIYKYCNKLGR